MQSRSRLEGQVYIQAQAELDLPPDTVLRVVTPLYGIPQSGLQWYLTYLSHHVESLGKQRATFEPWLLFKRAHGKVKGLMIIQVDDTLGCGDDDILRDE